MVDVDQVERGVAASTVRARRQGRGWRGVASVGLAGLVVTLVGGCRPGGGDPEGRGSEVVPGEPVAMGAGGLVSRPLRPAGKGDAGTRFAHLAGAEVGIPFQQPVDADHPLGFLYQTSAACGTVVIGDVDADGWPDVFLSGGSRSNGLFRNLAGSGLGFEEITGRSPGLDGGEKWALGGAFADVDGDGDLDLYLCHYGEPNELWLNRGDGSFEEAGAAWGVAVVDASHSPAFADYDRDGDLDLYLMTNRYQDPDGFRGEAVLEWVEGRPVVKPEFQEYYESWFLDEDRWGVNAFGREDYLFRNEGGRFVDVTREAGIAGRGDGLSVTWWDADGDGWPDIYVGNDFIAPDRFYRNRRDGTFADVAGEVIPHSSWFSMGADAGDLDGDGRPELLVADMAATNHFKQKTTMGAMGGPMLQRALLSQPVQLMRNALYINTGVGRFLEGAYWAELASSDWTWAVKFGDFDLDGRPDVYFTNGTVRTLMDSDRTISTEQLAAAPEWEYVKAFPPRFEKNLVFRNGGDLLFHDESAAWGLDFEGASYAAAAGDLDRDGDLDLVVANGDDDVSVFRNDTRGGSRVVVRLAGAGGNRFGTGARVELAAGGRTQVRELYPDRGFMSGDEPTLVFGLGGATLVDRLAVRWPSGRSQEFIGLQPGKDYTVRESTEAGEAEPEPESEVGHEPVFARADAAQFGRHSDPPYDDFQHQLLLPNRLSALGPGAAWGDVDGDGDDDVFTGGAAGSRGELRLNQGDGTFSPQWVEAFRDDKMAEDMGALFFDADRDGDLDLYVASGSYEFPAGDPLLADRLYLNDGGGNFERAGAEAMPDRRQSASCVAAADFDRDGDLDLFVGSRLVPREYPVVPSSALLSNAGSQEGGPKLEEVTADLAPGLASAGLVTAALWSDVDADGWVDLLVAVEWGPVRLYLNRQGRLEEATETAGLSSALGWWSGLAAGDADGDGDIDVFAGNTGTNTKYHASAEAPVRLYFGDYGGDGQRHLVEAEYEAGTLFPVRGKSCSTRAMPHLAEKFSTYRDFALAALTDIYEPAKLEESDPLEANTLESVLWLNDGSGKFRRGMLPRLVQISPVFGCAIRDFDGDAVTDLLLVQNFLGPQDETGPFDGGLGLMLRGLGGGEFEAMDPRDSGVVVPGDGTALTTADADSDGALDFLASRNGAEALFFRGGAPGLAVRLEGPPGNPAGAGARVQARGKSGVQTAEVYAGDGYLGQSAPVLVFGAPGGDTFDVSVTWPDGATSTHTTLRPGAGVVRLRHPGR